MLNKKPLTLKLYKKRKKLIPNYRKNKKKNKKT